MPLANKVCPCVQNGQLMPRRVNIEVKNSLVSQCFNATILQTVSILVPSLRNSTGCMKSTFAKHFGNGNMMMLLVGLEARTFLCLKYMFAF